MSFSSTMTELADAFRKRFGVTSKLSLDDMIKLITPSAFPSGTEILGRTKISRLFGRPQNIPLTLEAVPPVMSKPINLLITVSENNWLNLSGAKLIFNKSDGTQLSLSIPEIDTDYTYGQHWVKTVSVTIPANTSIANNKAILKIGGLSNVDTIEKIIVTYKNAGQPSSLSSAMTSLANAFRGYFKLKDPLSIQDMITLLGGTTSKDDTPAIPSQPVTPSKTVTVFENLQLSDFGGGFYSFTSPVPSGDTRLQVTLQIVNSGTGSVKISIPGTLISKTIATGGRGYHDLTVTLDIPSGMASSIELIYIDVGYQNVLKQLTVVAK